MLNIHDIKQILEGIWSIFLRDEEALTYYLTPPVSQLL